MAKKGTTKFFPYIVNNRKENHIFYHGAIQLVFRHFRARFPAVMYALLLEHIAKSRLQKARGLFGEKDHRQSLFLPHLFK